MNILVVGKAKTGTTFLSKSIQHSLLDANYFLEPKTVDFFEVDLAAYCGNNVVKIIFEHWSGRGRLRNALIHNELNTKFDRVVATQRDLRDEIISRLLYFVVPLNERGKLQERDVKRWIEVLQRKEQAPLEMSFGELVGQFDEIFGTNFDRHIQQLVTQDEDYRMFLSRSPKRIFVQCYEQLLAGEIASLSEHLGFEVRLDGGVGSLEKTRRSQAHNNWKHLFLKEDVARFREVLPDYEDWELAEASLDPDHYSGYVSRVTGISAT